MQERVKKLLRNIYKLNKVPNGLLFFGQEGVGKKTLAFEFAQSLLCLENSYPPCGKCTSCRYMQDFSQKKEEDLAVYSTSKSGKTVFMYLQGEHPDFVMVKPDKTEIKIDQIRGVSEFINLKPALSKRKVVMITEGEKMNTHAQNALLKPLEEPPLDTCFILVVNNINNILPTVKSRCFLVDVPPLTEEEIIKITGVRDKELLALSEGSITRLRLLLEKKNVVQMADILFSDKIHEVYKVVQKVEDMNLEDQELLLNVISVKLSRKLRENKQDFPAYERALDHVYSLLTNLKSGIRLSLGLFYLNLLINWR